MKFVSSLATLVAFTAFTAISAQSTTSLIVLGFDPQPLSVDVIGVDTASGQTTWAVQAGSGGDLPGTATIVEGSNYASIHYIGESPETTFTMDFGCNFQSGQAICSGTEQGQAVTQTDSVIPTPIAAVVGTTAPATATVTPSPSTGPVTSGGSKSPSSSGSSAPSPTQSSGATSMSSAWKNVLALGSLLTVGFAISM